MQKFRVLFFEILKPLVYCFNRGCFCTEFWVEMQIFRLLFFEVHGTLVYYFNRLCFSAIWSWNFRSVVLVCLVTKIYNLVVIMFPSDPKLAPFTKNVEFFKRNKRKLGPRGIVTAVLRETRKQSRCFKIKNQRPSNRNKPKTKVSQGPIFNKSLKIGPWLTVVFYLFLLDGCWSPSGAF